MKQIKSYDWVHTALIRRVVNMSEHKGIRSLVASAYKISRKILSAQTVIRNYMYFKS